jgi:hypothetical protein
MTDQFPTWSADGSKQEQLTDDPTQDAYPDWQPLPSPTIETDD